MSILRVGARVRATEAEGPGVRYALWLQGCSIRCPGCCNPHLFAPALGTSWSVADLLADIASVRGAVQGLTCLGGEPFEQAAPLADLARGVRHLGLSVMVFTGYTLGELRGFQDPGVHALLATIDVLVDGRYDQARPETRRRWVGSANQGFHYLTDRYDPSIEVAPPGEPWRSVEITIGPAGRWTANGWPVLEPFPSRAERRGGATATGLTIPLRGPSGTPRGPG
jgi:anaerobic ribonucleoside-triphosphate reductase activating protein